MKIQSVRPVKQSEYMKFDLKDRQFNFGVTHHSTGGGKLKVYDRNERAEFNVPLSDVVKPMKNWRIERR